MRSLRMKMVMIMVILILALMLTTGAFLMSGVGNFYVSQFYEQMEETFTPEFIVQLQRLSEEDNAPAQMKALLMAQAGLGIDITGRNVYILDQTGSVLDSSNQKTSVAMTQNILSAMNGEVGQSSAITNNYMDLAVPVDAASGSYIAYIRDNRATVDALTSELLSIILRALVLGLVICVILSFLLSQILITPIRALTIGTKRVAAGDYTGRVTVDSRDEIGDLTQNFNHMAKVLQDTIAEAENERNKLSTLFLHMTDGVVAFNAAGSVIHYNPAATQMLADIGHPYGEGEATYDVTFENVQAGLRTDYLFRLANHLGGIVLGTGDLSELALGWCTYGVGDQMSHYAVNTGVPKTLMQHLIRWVVASKQFDERVGEVLLSILNTEISPELVPAKPGEKMQSTQDKIGPYNLQDFTLYHVLRRGARPSKIAFLAEKAWSDASVGSWPVGFPEEDKVAYSLEEIVTWERLFLWRFFSQQFKRSALSNGPKVMAGGSLSPRGDWRMPSDVSGADWVAELDEAVKGLVD